MSQIHLQNWINWSKPDFYSMFVKSWIPFNAWYMDGFYDESSGRTRDRDILDYIKDNPNKFRDKLVNLLNRAGNNDEVEEFYYHLNLLDKELEAHTVVNRGRRIQFSNISLSSNNITSKIIEYRAYKYKCERITTPSPSCKCQIMKKSLLKLLIFSSRLMTYMLRRFMDVCTESLNYIRRSTYSIRTITSFFRKNFRKGC